ncbi:FAD/FMN-containing dehydrogenase [Archaeoglobus sulfaticallidus PM70-1]|uniref:D-lactate dehydrogenase (cytochrome) n=1 Tax=Archaeoglobus sulfaticallidus PM70-1 TaxID=387631 RepID=N0BMW6_9EURY|nr:FAD-binding oxidoreductase [Archaeoglobus sulfaticallidus]AGK61615.1 FAD/FMN-containing dehydrogenase [Archaeoglobus sulfaticallidus PM70-1]
METLEKFQYDLKKNLSRVSFDYHERKVYSHDISVLPEYIEKIACRDAEAIVQPQSVEEVLEILKLSKKYSKPIVPRGSATSGYGGVIPYFGGIVVDFSRMYKFEINEDEKTFIAEPGAVWWDVEKRANKKGLSLRVYPTSALSSTVGGWIAQGGVGIGSMMFGGIKDCVERLQVADFNGLRFVEENELKYYVGMEGTTGLITSAKLRLMEYKEKIPVGLEIKDFNDIKRLNAYSAVFFSSGYIRMINEAEGSDYEEKDVLIAVFLDRAEVNGFDAKDFWEERFYPMRVKRKWPSIVMTEILMPLENLENYCKIIGKELKGRDFGIQIHFCKEGGRILGNVIIILASDENDRRFTKDWRKSMKLLKMGLKLSGKPYSTGMFLSHLSKKYLKDYEELLRFKKSVDPDNLLNPGKIFPAGKLPRIMKLAEIFA